MVHLVSLKPFKLYYCIYTYILCNHLLLYLCIILCNHLLLYLYIILCNHLLLYLYILCNHLLLYLFIYTVQPSTTVFIYIYCAEFNHQATIVALDIESGTHNSMFTSQPSLIITCTLTVRELTTASFSSVKLRGVSSLGLRCPTLLFM